MAKYTTNGAYNTVLTTIQAALFFIQAYTATTKLKITKYQSMWPRILWNTGSRLMRFLREPLLLLSTTGSLLRIFAAKL